MRVDSDGDRRSGKTAGRIIHGEYDTGEYQEEILGDASLRYLKTWMLNNESMAMDTVKVLPIVCLMYDDVQDS